MNFFNFTSGDKKKKSVQFSPNNIPATHKKSLVWRISLKLTVGETTSNPPYRCGPLAVLIELK